MNNDLAVIFDFDGTLFFRTPEINHYVFNKALTVLGKEQISYEEANTTVGDKVLDACKRILKTEDDSDAVSFLQEMMKYIPAAIKEYSQIEPDALQMLFEISGMVPLAICSNAEENYLNSLIDNLNIRQYFKKIHWRRTGYDKKQIIAEILKELNVCQGVVVGDRLEDVQAGKENHCITVAIQNDFGYRDAVGADFNVSNHKEMKKVLINIINNVRRKSGNS